MRRSFRSVPRRREEGSVAVEAGICLGFILVPLIAFVFLFGKFFWYYTVAQKAVHDSTLYLAAAPLSELKSQAALSLANHIVSKEIADLDAETTIEPSFNCGYRISPNFPDLAFGNCSANSTPDAVQTFAIMTVPMPFYFFSESIRLVPIASMSYVGK